MGEVAPALAMLGGVAASFDDFVGARYDQNRKTEDFRRFDDSAPSGVREFYRLNHQHQTYEFVLAKKREFLQHLTAYVVINLVLNVIWLLVTPDAFYWPVFPLLGWGIGIVFHGLDAYAPAAPSEARIRREMGRMERR